MVTFIIKLIINSIIIRSPRQLSHNMPSRNKLPSIRQQKQHYNLKRTHNDFDDYQNCSTFDNEETYPEDDEYNESYNQQNRNVQHIQNYNSPRQNYIKQRIQYNTKVL